MSSTCNIKCVAGHGRFLACVCLALSVHILFIICNVQVKINIIQSEIYILELHLNKVMLKCFGIKKNW